MMDRQESASENERPKNPFVACPQCGNAHIGATKLSEDSEPDLWQGSCFACGYRGPCADSRSAALSAWNKAIKNEQYGKTALNSLTNDNTTIAVVEDDPDKLRQHIAALQNTNAVLVTMNDSLQKLLISKPPLSHAPWFTTGLLIGAFSMCVGFVVARYYGL